MADDAERIGGIEVEAGVSQAGLDQDLAAIEAKLKAAAQRWQGIVTITANTAMGAAPAGGAPARAAATQSAAPVSITPVRRGGASARDQSAFERAIADALAKEDAAMGNVADTISQSRQESQEKIARAINTQSTQVRADVAQISSEMPPLVIPIDASEFKETLGELTAELRAWRTQAEKIATISPQMAPPGGIESGGAMGGRGGVRRKNLRDRGIGTEASQQRIYTYDPDVYEEDEAKRAAASARERDRIFTQRETTARIAQRREDNRALQQAALVDAQAAAAQRKADSDRELKELSYEAQQRNAALESANATPALTEQRRRQRDQERAQARNATGTVDPAFRARQEEAERERIARNESVRRGAAQATAGPNRAGAGTGQRREAERPTAVDPDLQEDIIQARIQRQRTALAAGSRTGRVGASAVGALFFGTRGREIEATTRLADAERKLIAIERSGFSVLERQRELIDDVAHGRRGAAEELRKFSQDDDNREIIEEQANAQKNFNSALEDTRRLQSGGNVVRNLAAITLGTTAFGAALAGVSFALHTIVPAAQDWLDVQTGFLSTSTRVTSALAQQTIAQRGNVEAVLAQEAATAGLSSAAASFLDTQLQLTTQIKAGALAQQQASELFRAGRGAQPQQGLVGGFGGLFGGPLLAQQLGGGKGFSEIIAGDIANLRGGGGNDLLGQAGGNFQSFLDFATNDRVRRLTTEAAKQQKNPLFDNLGTLGRVNPLTGPAFLAQDVLGGIGDFAFRGGKPPTPPPSPPPGGEFAQRTDTITAYINDLTQASERGAEALGKASNVSFDYARSAEEVATATRTAAAAGNPFIASLAQYENVIVRVNGKVASSVQELNAALEQTVVGRGIPDASQLGRLALAQERQRQREAQASIPAMQAQFEFERPAFVAGVNREQQFALNAQLPAQAALSALASPNLPPGTGMVAANADEAERIKDATKETTALQEKLNDYYAQGRQILIETFQVPPQLLNSITATGRQIASIQANIRNEQASFQVAQYNYQLQIAKRTLADIGGLTGRNFGEGQSYLGVLERQNLALSRQAQLLQFSMQQRNINFQVARAGFEAPGVTPEERQANVKEAQIEASFAQKQLDIQRQMFGNQVQIVDIQNLRQGVDLAAQIQLLLQGRKLTIDTAADEEKLLRLQQLQQEQVARAGTYIEKVTKLTGRAFSEIQNLETAAGTAMYNAATYAADAFNVYLRGVYASLTSFAASMNPTQSANGFRGDPGLAPRNATGYVGMTSGATMTGVGWMGEADQEAYAILRNPKQLLAGDLGGGGGDTYITFGDVTVREDGDIQKIAIAVSNVINRDAALRGLRTA